MANKRRGSARRRALSLRLRLFLVILPPLFAVSILLGLWRFQAAQETSDELFDRGLLAAALAISRDVAISEGDALSPITRSFISDAGGGEIFYHVTGPGGYYVTGYAYPPRHPSGFDPTVPNYYVADYRGEEMRVLRMTEARTIANLTGDSVVTVWQRVSDRQAFARELALRAIALIAGLMATLALVVWFGVQLGLRPLNDLQEAIRIRSPDDLALIRRPVPKEVAGVVGTLNRLFGQVKDNIEAHQVFISDAAHQLRNPAAALLALAETLPDVTDESERDARQAELIDAARSTARLTNQLLQLERLRYGDTGARQVFDLNDVIEEVCQARAHAALTRDLDFSLDRSAEPLPVEADPTLIGEAVTNLVDNALRHGGDEMTRITVRTAPSDAGVTVTVQDDGVGIPAEQSEAAFRRFSQLRNGEGTGLGLSIVEQVVRRHHGTVRLVAAAKGTTIRIELPRA